MKLNFKPLAFRSVLAFIAAGQLFLSTSMPCRSAEAVTPGADQPAKPGGKPNAKLWQKDRDDGQKAMAQGDVTSAQIFLEAALDEAEKFSAKDYRLAESLSDLGKFRASTRDFAAAEPLFRRALVIRHADANRLAEAECLVDLGRTCQHLGNFDEAEKFLLEARQVIDKKVGADHPLDAICRFELAQLYFEKQDYAKAEPLFKQALELFRNPPSKVKFQQTDAALYGNRAMRYTYRPNYAYAFETLYLLSQLYMNQNLPDKVEASLKDALKLAGEQPNVPESEMQAALGNLGSFYLSRTNYPQAEVMLIRLERAQEKSLGLKDPATFSTLVSLASAYEGDGKLADAEATHKKILAAREKFQNPDDEEILAATDELAAFHVRHEQYEAAAAIYERLWERADKLRGGDLREVPLLTQLVITYTKLGRDADLEKVYQRQITIYEKTFGPNNKAVLQPVEGYAQLLRKQKRDAEAEPLEARAKAIRMGTAQ